ncbi:MAG: hypothetical protein WC551_10970 [Patescibacteria group bacterium]
MARSLSPLGGAGWQFFDDNGDPLTGGFFYTYLAGTTTPTPTYTGLTGPTTNSNPITLDAAGRPPNEIWLDDSTIYKFELRSSTGSLVGNWDNIAGLGAGVASGVESISSIAALRSVTIGTATTNMVFVTSYYSTTDIPDGGGGTFVYDSSDTTSSDNGVTTIIDASLRRWKRQYTGPLDVRCAGVVGDGVTNDATAFQRAADLGAVHLMVAKGSVVYITTDVTFGAGVILQVDGTISGTQRLAFNGSANVFGEGSIVTGDDRTLFFVAGDISVSGLTIGKAACFGILIVPSATINSIRIHDNLIRGAHYGILRNSGSPNPCYNTIITDNVIENSTGDGIEWNVAVADRRVLIANNSIYNITGTVANSGIGIGVAGGTYVNTSDYSTYIQQIEIIDNAIRGARQGIHVESAAYVKISGNTVSDITSSYGSTIPVYGIITYALEQCQISDNFVYSCNQGISVQLGVTAAVYTGSPRNMLVANNYIVDAGNLSTNIAWYSGTTIPIGVVKNNTVINGALSHSGVCDLILDGNTVRCAGGATGFTLDYNTSTFGSSFSASRRFMLRITNNMVFDVIGRTTVSLSNISDPAANVGNFNVTEFGNSFTVDDVDYIARPVNRVVYTSEAGLGGVPYGVELQVGTLVVDTATPARYLVTVAGSRNKASDTYAVVDAATGVIRTTNHTWSAAANHSYGQAITLDDGVSPVTAYVSRVYTEAAQYRMSLMNSAGVTLNLGTLGSGTITATNPLTAVAV